MSEFANWRSILPTIQSAPASTSRRLPAARPRPRGVAGSGTPVTACGLSDTAGKLPECDILRAPWCMPRPPMERRAKIVATLGPATADERMLGPSARRRRRRPALQPLPRRPGIHRRALRLVRKVARARGLQIPVLLDLMGPRYRLGEIAGGPRELRQGEHVTLGELRPGRPAGRRSRVPPPSADRRAGADRQRPSRARDHRQTRPGGRRPGDPRRRRVDPQGDQPARLEAPLHDLGEGRLGHRLRGRRARRLPRRELRRPGARHRGDPGDRRESRRSRFRSSPSSSARRRSRTSRRSSQRPTPSWWRAATSASRSRCIRCRCCRSASSPPAGGSASR